MFFIGLKKNTNSHFLLAISNNTGLLETCWNDFELVFLTFM